MKNNLGRLLKQAVNQLTRHFDQFAKQYDLTATQMSIIDYLSRNKQNAIFQRDIEHEFLIQRSTASTLLRRMEKKDLLYRISNGKDARQKEVKLAPKSLGLEKKIVSYMNRQQLPIDQQFSKDEIKLFYQMLHQIIKIND